MSFAACMSDHIFFCCDVYVRSRLLLYVCLIMSFFCDIYFQTNLLWCGTSFMMCMSNHIFFVCDVYVRSHLLHHACPIMSFFCDVYVQYNLLWRWFISRLKGVSRDGTNHRTIICCCNHPLPIPPHRAKLIHLLKKYVLYCIGTRYN